MNTFPTPQPDQGATNPPDPPEDATASGNDGSGDLRRQLAAIIAHPKMPASERSYFESGGCDRCPKALDAADAVIEAGFRLVSEDDTTVERVAEQTRKHALDVGRSNRSQDADYCTCGELIEDWDVHWVRAAVRALREGQ